MTLRLHYAPDNASLCVRLALEELRLPFDTALVDRRAGAQRSPAYLALNPHGMIPVLETPEGPIFETAAILLWLSDRHRDHAVLMPAPEAPDRGLALAWLFWLANTLHPALRMMFYGGEHIGPEMVFALHERTAQRTLEMLDRLEAALPGLGPWLGADQPSALDCYLVPMLRWCALYPEAGTGWFDLARWPGLQAAATRFETRPSVAAAIRAEGLGPRPFTAPRPPHPPEGYAT
ncbi:glutathione S-transferase family protein [Limimaricola pyoseonensis]|uniref:Glutathione S-transferase n=1 Tax=Limimaricola pyoseonensis TaxID=521013 RepID=A0A1G7CYX5_9RHOB|nr:glutathione S-transferase family protein [Limimaricola pyoseonensis]SDE43685.1 glutathione S-transferase [Limimaricola pyoseonensis]